MKKINFLLFPLVLLLFGVPLLAQKTTKAPAKPEPKVPVHLKLMAHNYGDHIALRWASPQTEAWRYLNQRGFVLERLILDGATNTATAKQFTALSPEPIRPWTRQQWNAALSSNDTLAVVAAECLLGQTKFPEESNFFRQLDLRAKDEASRTSFALLSADLSPLAATGLGLRYDDRDVQPGRKYVYRLRVLDDPANRFATDTALYVIATDEQFENPVPPQPDATPGDSLVTLRWVSTGAFTAYHVERSADGGKSWMRLTHQPYISIIDPKASRSDSVFYSDRLKANYLPYQYRVRGYNVFGDLSEPSKVAEAMGIDLTPSAPPLLVVKNTATGVVELSWKMPPGAVAKGFAVGKSRDINGPWTALNTEILPPDARHFTDKEASEFERNFYCVWALDEHGNQAASLPAYAFMKNSAPPAAPVWVGGQVDTSGLVTLRWRRNTEPDLMGYQISFSNSEQATFVVLNSEFIKDTTYSYRIPLKNLTEKIWYTIRAVDLNYEVSAVSQKLCVTKPDVMAPVSPVIRNYAVRDTGVLVEWAASTSADVVKHVLLRRLPGAANWQTVAELPAKANQYFDKDVAPETYYEYTLFALDDAGLHSPEAHVLSVRTLPIVTREPITELACTPLTDKKSIQLTWAYPKSSAGQVRFKVYRIAPNGSLRLLGELAGNEHAYEDKSVKSGEVCRYAVRAFHRAGGASPVARTGEVRI